jgi:hypothetical protein
VVTGVQQSQLLLDDVTPALLQQVSKPCTVVNVGPDLLVLGSNVSSRPAAKQPQCLSILLDKCQYVVICSAYCLGMLRNMQVMHTRDCPPLDLLIRTSGEQRLFDFLL